MYNSYKRFIGILTFMILFNGCSTIQIKNSLYKCFKNKVGNGEIRFSPNTLQKYFRYLSFSNKQYFVVSKDGKVSDYRYCYSGNNCSSCDTLMNTLRNCENKSKDVCYVFAVEDVIHWKNHGAFYAPEPWRERQHADNTVKHADPEGVILYFPGFSAKDYISRNNTVPFYVRKLNEKGWDVYRYNYPVHRVFYNDSFVVQLIKDIVLFHRKSYKKIILAGQSKGAWLILRALSFDNKDFKMGFDVYAALLAAPASYDSKDREYNLRMLIGERDNNAKELYEKIKNIWSKDTKYAFFFFNKDKFDVQGRAGKVEDLLSSAALNYMLINQPDELEGHHAALSLRFSYMFADCLYDYLMIEGNRRYECQAKKFDNTVLDWVTNREELLQLDGIKRLSIAEIKDIFSNQVESATSISNSTKVNITFYLKESKDRYRYSAAVTSGEWSETNSDWNWVVKGDWWLNEKKDLLCIKEDNYSDIFATECYEVYRFNNKVISVNSRTGKVDIISTFRDINY